jgi:hypothetical protein
MPRTLSPSANEKCRTRSAGQSRGDGNGAGLELAIGFEGGTQLAAGLAIATLITGATATAVAAGEGVGAAVDDAAVVIDGTDNDGCARGSLPPHAMRKQHTVSNRTTRQCMLLKRPSLSQVHPVNAIDSAKAAGALEKQLSLAAKQGGTGTPFLRCR